MRSFVFLGLLIAAAPAQGAPLPFNDGIYASSLSICDAIEGGMESWQEYISDGIVRVINGATVSDYVETTCTASNVRRDGHRVLFTAQCITDELVETVEGG